MRGRRSQLEEEDRRWKCNGEISSEIVCYTSPRWIGLRMGGTKIPAEHVVGRNLRRSEIIEDEIFSLSSYKLLLYRK